jgi:hypothetical protein
MFKWRSLTLIRVYRIMYNSYIGTIVLMLSLALLLQLLQHITENEERKPIQYLDHSLAGDDDTTWRYTQISCINNYLRTIKIKLIIEHNHLWPYHLWTYQALRAWSCSSNVWSFFSNEDIFFNTCTCGYSGLSLFKDTSSWITKHYFFL